MPGSSVVLVMYAAAVVLGIRFRKISKVLAVIAVIEIASSLLSLMFLKINSPWAYMNTGTMLPVLSSIPFRLCASAVCIILSIILHKNGYDTKLHIAAKYRKLFTLGIVLLCAGTYIAGVFGTAIFDFMKNYNKHMDMIIVDWETRAKFFYIKNVVMGAVIAAAGAAAALISLIIGKRKNGI